MGGAYSKETRYYTLGVGEFSFQGNRACQEDAVDVQMMYGRDPAKTFAAVYDGHFGAGCARYAAKHLSRLMLRDPQFDEQPALAMREAFLAVDAGWRKARKRKDPAGACAAVCLVRDRLLVLGHVGDCRVILSRAGRAKQLTMDHTPAQAAEEARVKAAGGHVTGGRVHVDGHDQAISVTRALGDVPFKPKNDVAGALSAEPDILHAQLDDQVEFVLLCTDGVFETFTVEDAVDYVRDRLRSKVDPPLVAEGLCRQAAERGSPDNVSAAVLAFRFKTDADLQREAQRRNQAAMVARQDATTFGRMEALRRASPQSSPSSSRSGSVRPSVPSSASVSAQPSPRPGVAKQARK